MIGLLSGTVKPWEWNNFINLYYFYIIGRGNLRKVIVAFHKHKPLLVGPIKLI